MSVRRKMLYAAALVLCIAILFSGCSVQTRQTITDIDPNNLGGIDVGVPMAWSPDYILTGRTDINLLRFDAQTDALLALKYGRLDAYASEAINARYLVSLQPGYKILPTPVGEDSFVAFFSNESAEACEKFNAFIKDFKQTEEYADILRRIMTYENGEFVTKKVPVNEDGEVLKMAFSAEAYPYTGIDFETGEYVGFEMEIAQWFAYKCGYRLEPKDYYYEGAIIALTGCDVNFYMCNISNAYRDEVELTHKAIVSDPYIFVDLVLVVVGDKDSLNDGLGDDLQY